MFYTLYYPFKTTLRSRFYYYHQHITVGENKSERVKWLAYGLTATTRHSQGDPQGVGFQTLCAFSCQLIQSGCSGGWGKRCPDNHGHLLFPNTSCWFPSLYFYIWPVSLLGIPFSVSRWINIWGWMNKCLRCIALRSSLPLSGSQVPHL